MRNERRTPLFEEELPEHVEFRWPDAAPAGRRAARDTAAAQSVGQHGDEDHADRNGQRTQRIGRSEEPHRHRHHDRRGGRDRRDGPGGRVRGRAPSRRITPAKASTSGAGPSPARRVYSPSDGNGTGGVTATRRTPPRAATSRAGSPGEGSVFFPGLTSMGRPAGAGMAAPKTSRPSRPDTARIHRLSPDIRRPGRVGDLIIPILDPTGKDREDFLRWTLKGSGPDALTPKAVEVLHYLASRPDQLVTKDELLSAVWPDVIVSDASIKVCVREIRGALEDDAVADLADVVDPALRGGVHLDDVERGAVLTRDRPDQGDADHRQSDRDELTARGAAVAAQGNVARVKRHDINAQTAILA